jgi:hypothetical protein
MKRFAISLAGLLCLALSACAPPSKVPPAPTGPTTVVLKSVNCSDGDLLNHVHYTNFTPGPPFRSIPTPDTQQVNPDIQLDLAAAFNANPTFSKNELCPLDGIFINRAQCSGYAPSSCSTMADKDIAANSWGFRTSNLSATPGQKYVAISLGLWRGNTCPAGSGQTICAPSLTQFHQRLAKALLDKTAGMSVSMSPTFQTDPKTDTAGLAVLTALAHERGHIYWFETFVQTPGDTPTNLVTLAGLFCGGTIYPGGLWQGKSVELPTNRFVEFGVLNPNSPVAGLPSLLRSRNPHAVGLIDATYTGGLYPSLLAAYSSDEDFVEAFQWSVLRNAGLSDVSINVNGTAARPILHGGRGNMQWEEDKLQCFDSVSG